MCTVPNVADAARVAGSALADRRAEYPDVFADGGLDVDVAGLIGLSRQGLVSLGWLHELFADRAAELVVGVRALDRTALRDAYRLLFVEEPAMCRAVVRFLESLNPAAGAVHVVDAVAEVVGAATCVEDLARAWEWFVHGEDLGAS
jgi:hypothetical protein